MNRAHWVTPLVFFLIMTSRFSFTQQTPTGYMEGGPPGMEPMQSAVGLESTGSLIQIKGEMIEKQEGKITFTYYNPTPIKDVIQVFAQTTGLNFVVSPKVDARVTATFKDAPVKDAFLSILSANGIYYLEQGNIIKILTLNEYKSELQQRYLKTKTYDASIIDIENFATIIKPMLTPGIGKVTVDKQSSKIIVMDVADNFARIDNLMKELSELPLMVEIETRILQVDLQDNNEVGVRWEALNIGDAINLGFIFSPETGISGDNKINITGSKTFDRVGMDVIISALAHDYDVTLISQPKVLAINRGKAIIHIGDKVPYVSSITKSTTTTDTTSKVEFIDIGIKLEVSPMITKNDEIRLSIKAEMSTYQEIAITATENAPKKITTEIECDAVALNGQPIILGGLIRNEKTYDLKAVPILGQIPILKYLFSHSKEELKKSELIIFMTPRIIKGGTSNILFENNNPELLQQAGFTNQTITNK